MNINESKIIGKKGSSMMFSSPFDVFFTVRNLLPFCPLKLRSSLKLFITTPSSLAVPLAFCLLPFAYEYTYSLKTIS